MPFCRRCGEPAPRFFSPCPYCGAANAKMRWHHWAGIALGVVLLLWAVAALLQWLTYNLP